MLAYWFNLMSSNQSLVFTILTGVPPDKRSPHGDYKRLAQRKSFISEVMTEQNLFSISGTLQLDTPAPTSHTMPSLWVFQGQQWSKVATFDMTQITSSLDRDPFHNYVQDNYSARRDSFADDIRLFVAIMRGSVKEAETSQLSQINFTPCNVPSACCHHAKGSFFTTHLSNVPLKCTLVVCGAEETESNGRQKYFSMIDLSRIVNKKTMT